MAPLRAAWAPAGLPRHPADVNCLLVKWQRALPTATAGLNGALVFRERAVHTAAFWVALCLNQPEYQHYLLRRSGAAVLPRVRLSVLRELKVPMPPVEAELLAAQVWEWQEESLANTKDLAWLLDEVDAQVNALAIAAEEDQEPASRSWGRFFQAADVADSLIPRHVTLGHLQRLLRDEVGWRPLTDLLSPQQPSRRRRTAAGADDRYLRLSDVGTDLSIKVPEMPDAPPMAGRVYAEPLATEEVLLSLLVTNPRVAFAGAVPEPDIFVTDHWERLRFRETPGAWALVLNTSPVRRQLGLLAMGTVQQFAHPDALRSLVLPPIEDDLRRKWDRQLRRYQVRHQELEARWRQLWPQAQALYQAVHSRPARQETRP
jgi:hypothetical protein